MCYVPIHIFDLLYSEKISSWLSFLYMPVLHIFLVISISWVIKVCIMGIIALKLTCPSFHSVFKRLSLKSDFFFFSWNNYQFNKVFIGGNTVHSHNPLGLALLCWKILHWKNIPGNKNIISFQSHYPQQLKLVKVESTHIFKFFHQMMRF